MVDKIGLIIQAHMSSERLPGKILKEIHGVSVLGHVIERLKDVRNAPCIIVATSTLSIDDAVEAESKRYGALVCRGDDSDVLSRFYHAAKENNIGVIARICSDNTFLDPDIISDEIEVFLNSNYDIVTSGKSVPLGLGTEVFSFASLESAFNNATTPYEHEHVCPYIYEHGTAYYHEIDLSHDNFRLTLDTKEDWELINEVASRVDSLKCRVSDLIEVFKKEPQLLKINEMIVQRP